MTPQELAVELKKYLSDKGISNASFGSGDYSSSEYEELLALYGEMETVAEERDPYKNSNELNDEFFVVHFTKLNIFLRLESQYSSWDGPRDGKIFPVEPYEVTVTKYRKIT